MKGALRHRPSAHKCGLFRTTKPLPEHESTVGAGLLVYFHNHSLAGGESELPCVVLPDHNVFNRWHFHGAGTSFHSLAWADSLVRLPREGFYSLRKQLDFDAGDGAGSWPKGTLVQLGYTRTGDPILFIAQQRASLEENDLLFSDRGVGIPHGKLAALEPINVFEEPPPEGGHGTGQH